MTHQEHIERHKQLHRNLDELMADYIEHSEKGLDETSVMQLMKWSYQQTLNPTERK
jgi:hypothetical protein